MRRDWSALPRALLAVMTFAYPLLVYWGAGRWSPVATALCLAALMGLRAWSTRHPAWLVAAAGGVLLAIAVNRLDGSWLPLRLYPVGVSLVLLIVFAASVLRPPTVIERIARLTDSHLSPEVVAYTRRVTLVWCGFFAFNALMALITALWCTAQVWLLYNGLLVYGLMGALFAGEWLLRRRLRSRLAGDGSLHG